MTGANYPNPFNPMTTIEFSVPHSSFVTLKVLDVLGRDIATLIAKQFTAGRFSSTWDGSRFQSGVYFYRLQARLVDGGQAGSFIETKKLILLK